MKELFEESRINQMILTNRFVRSATWSGLADDTTGACTPALVELMSKLAAGGVGLIITGHAYVHRRGKHNFRQLGIHTDKTAPGLQSLTQAVHDQGRNIVIQLGYGGAYLSKSRVRSMTQNDILGVIDAFSRAAVRAKQSGFDGVQVMAAHGFLLSQMLCPRYNDRTDAYGGILENRARLLLEVVQSIRNAVGQDYPVLIKLNGEDFVERGLTLQESISVGEMLENSGADAIELSGGLLNNPNLMQTHSGTTDEDEAFFKKHALAFKKQISIPLILVGGIRSLQLSRKLVEDGSADHISMCRPFIREPGLINRWKDGNHGNAACTSCNNCVERLKEGNGLACVPKEDHPKEPMSSRLFREVSASPPYPTGTAYRISLGIESWETIQIPVVKVEMLSKGNATGRNPSYPLGSDDHLKVNQAIIDLLEGIT